jgi:hypothetical protein
MQELEAKREISMHDLNASRIEMFRALQNDFYDAASEVG